MLNHSVIEKDWLSAQKLMESALEKDFSKGFTSLRERFNTAKSELVDLFPEDGRISATIKDTERTIDITMFSDTAEKIFGEQFYKMNNKYDIFEGMMYQFIPVRNFICSLAHFITPDEIRRNKITNPNLVDPSRPEKRILPGTKVTKWITALIKSADNPYCMQWELSCLFTYCQPTEEFKSKMNDVTIEMLGYIIMALGKGDITVVLSVNPLDILMSSLSTANWHSCHEPFSALYQTGTFSYMCDGATAVAYAYIKKEDFQDKNYRNAKLKNMPVKIWRQMVYFDLYSLTAMQSREYPCAMGFAREIVSDLCTKILMNHKNIGSYSVGKMSFFDEWVRFRTDFAYQDYLTAAVGIADSYRCTPSLIRTSVAELIPCLVCGEMRTDSNHEVHECYDCQPHECDRCGAEIYKNDTYNYDGGRYCQECYSHYTREETCGICNKDFLASTLYSIEGVYACNHCRAIKYDNCDHCGYYKEKVDMKPVEITYRGYNQTERWCKTCVTWASVCDCGVIYTGNFVEGCCTACIKNNIEEEIYYWDIMDLTNIDTLQEQELMLFR